jgi:hypothetical protein
VLQSLQKKNILNACSKAGAMISKPELTTYADACTADPKHYVALYEDDYIRVLRARYEPHEASAMHGHPPTLIIPVNLSKLRRAQRSGLTDIIESHAWHAIQISLGIHRYENLADISFDAVVIEMKYPNHTPITDKHRRQ